MPSVKGSSSSLMVAVECEGTHLMQTTVNLNNLCNNKFKMKEKKVVNYPNGILLCNHKCVQPKPVFGMTSDTVEDCLSSNIDRTPPSPFCFRFSDARGAELSSCGALPHRSSFTFPANSENPRKGLKGDDGVAFKDTTVGEADDVGARTVKVRSLDVKFDA